ncbi:MAG: sporulation protein YunB [Bacilli bacterium]|nr:sporulation protein YunB [Bacilli bacterium]MDD4809288.1 sporulation protein YunB [Bacilli bacterium]
MKKKMSLRKKILLNNSKNRNINKILIIFILVFITIVIVFNYINHKISPILLNYAEVETKKIASLIISKAINQEVSESLDVDKLFIISKDDKGEISTIDFDPVIVNKFLLQAINTVQTNLKNLENGNIDEINLGENVLLNYDQENLKKGVFFEMPMGVVFNNVLLANVGPKIPVRFRLIGDIIANIESKVTNYGINNALIEVTIKLVLNERVILPVTSKSITVFVNIPIALKIIQGTVPNYYFNGLNNSSPILKIPME